MFTRLKIEQEWVKRANFGKFEIYQASHADILDFCMQKLVSNFIPVDNFGTVVGENPTLYGILALWAVDGLSIVYWDVHVHVIATQ